MNQAQKEILAKHIQKEKDKNSKVSISMDRLVNIFDTEKRIEEFLNSFNPCVVERAPEQRKITLYF